MTVINELLANKLLIAAVWGWFVAQVLKTIIYIIINKSFDPERLTGDGGMPSSHSATVMAVVTGSYLLYGPSSFEFAISAVLAIIVMHDAMGVRRETGIQAKVINNMMEWFTKLDQDIPVEEKLKEFVGHTPMQVLFGAILGVIVGIIVTSM